MRYILLLTTLCLSFVVNGQADIQHVQIPDSPNVAAFGKYIDFPISLYTGQAQVSVPIHNLTVKDITVPISLSYHTGGVRVEEIASSVGLNWTLNANSVINRRVNGNLDDISLFFYDEPPYEISHGSFNDHISTTTRIGKNDSEHDYYYFSAGSYQGKYIMDFKNGYVPVQFPVQDLAIDHGSKKITTPEGLIYYYAGVGEINSPITNCSGESSTTTGNPLGRGNTWFLSKIESQTSGAYVNFIYEPTYFEYEQNGTQTKYKAISGGRIDTDCNIINRIYSNRLLAIETSDGQRVDFVKGGLRADFKDDHLLSEIIISNQLSNTTKKFRLNHKYLERGQLKELSFIDPINILDNRREKLRLVLTGVQEVGNNGNLLPPYEFQYNISGNSLPSRRSFSQDHWGFYNGKLINTTLVPALIYNGELLEGADRTPSLHNAIQGSLSKITYPTGGSRTLQYELNECINCLFLDYSNASANAIYETHAIGDVDFFNNQGQNVIEKDFEVDGPLPVEIILDFETDSSFYNNIKFQLFSLNDDNSINRELLTSDNYRELDNVTSFSETLSHHVFDGKYKLRLTIIDQQWAANQDFYQLKVRWITIDDVNGVSMYHTAGGLRTKQIDIFDPSSNDIIHRKFEYGNGYITGWQSYARESLSFVENNHQIHPRASIIRSSNPILSTSNTDGGVIGYSKVTTRQDGNGYVEDYFYSPQHFQDKGYGEENFGTVLNAPLDGIPWFRGGFISDTQDWFYPFSLWDEKDWKRGLLQEKRFYRQDSTLLRKIENKYLFYDDLARSDSAYTDKVYKVRGSRTNIESLLETYITFLAGGGFSDDFPNYSGFMNINFYTLESSWYDMDETIETNYFDNGTSVSTTTKYEYSDNQRTIKTQEATNSKGEIVKTTTLYPTDFNTSEANLLVSKNLLNNPIKIISAVDNQVVSELINKYQENNENVNLIEVDTRYKGNADPIVVQIEYDDYGNTTEVTREDGITTSYIWGYNNQYPIAKIENADYNKIRQALGFSSTNQVKNLNQGDIDLINGLRNNSIMADAMIYTYTYDPLIGITSITDPRGYTMTHHYDALNRLEFVKDADGNLIRENTYNYKNN